jgi:hypothetical protein
MHKKELTASHKACKHGLQASLQSGKRGRVPIVKAPVAARVLWTTVAHAPRMWPTLQVAQLAGSVWADWA